MRIAWLTPDDARSAIGHYSHEVASSLRRHADVDIWAPVGTPGLASGADVAFGQNERSLDALQTYDVVVHNLGDHLAYHRAIYRASRRHPGVVILHDRSLNNLFLGLHADDAPHGGSYLTRIEQLYGGEARGLAERYAAGRLARTWADGEELMRISFTEDALVRQRAAVTHSRIHAADVSRCWAGPVRALPFPTYPSLLERRPRPRRCSGNRMALLSVGRLNRNKHVHDVIAALGEDPQLARRVRYAVVGPSAPGDPYARELNALIARHSLAGTVTLLGYQPPTEYARLLDAAEIHVNLRYPSTESGSASAAEQLASGRPLIVYDSGGLAELPDDAVVKVPVGDRRALGAAIWGLVESASRRAAVGAAGRREAEARSLDRYAEGLHDFFTQLDDWPWRGLADRVGAALTQIGMGPEMVAHSRVGRELAGLLPRWSGQEGT